MKRLSVNIASLVGSEVLRRILGFLSVAYMGRVLLVGGFGEVMIGLTVLSYVALGGSAGLHLLGTRAVAGMGSAVAAGELIGVRLVNTAVLYLVAAGSAVLFIPSPSLRDVVLITAASAFLHAMFVEWYFQGKERMTPNAVARTLGALVYLLALLAFVREPGDVRWAAGAAVCGDVVSTGYLLAQFHRAGERLRPVVTISSWKRLMSAALPFGAGSVLGHLSVNLPVLVLGVMAGTAEAGVFSAGSKLVFFILMVDRILNAVLIPASVRFRTASPDVLRGRLTEAMFWVLVIGLPAAAGGAFLAADIVAFVFGPAFAGAASVFTVLVWYFLLTLLHTVYTSGVIASGADRDYRNVMIASAAMYAIAVVGGAASGGATGAAAGMVAAEGATLLLMRRALVRASGPVGCAQLPRLVAATLLMTALLFFLTGWHLLAVVAAGGVTYVLATLVLKAVSWEEYRTLAGRLV